MFIHFVTLYICDDSSLWRGRRDSNPRLRRQTATELESAVLPLNYAPIFFTLSGGHATPSSMYFLKECPFEMMRNRRSLSGNSDAYDRTSSSMCEVLQASSILIPSFRFSCANAYKTWEDHEPSPYCITGRMYAGRNDCRNRDPNACICKPNHITCTPCLFCLRAAHHSTSRRYQCVSMLADQN